MKDFTNQNKSIYTQPSYNIRHKKASTDKLANINQNK